MDEGGLERKAISRRRLLQLGGAALATVLGGEAVAKPHLPDIDVRKWNAESGQFGAFESRMLLDTFNTMIARFEHQLRAPKDETERLGLKRWKEIEAIAKEAAQRGESREFIARTVNRNLNYPYEDHASNVPTYIKTPIELCATATGDCLDFEYAKYRVFHGVNIPSRIALVHLKDPTPQDKENLKYLLKLPGFGSTIEELQHAIGLVDLDKPGGDLKITDSRHPGDLRSVEQVAKEYVPSGIYERDQLYLRAFHLSDLVEAKE